jgi:hypothetical protein
MQHIRVMPVLGTSLLLLLLLLRKDTASHACCWLHKDTAARILPSSSVFISYCCPLTTTLTSVTSLGCRSSAECSSRY